MTQGTTENVEQITEQRMPKVGEGVTWTDATGVDFEVLVTCVWSATLINVVIVSNDESEQDSYGRQIKRHTSQQHKSVNQVHGYYWRFKDEGPNDYKPPVSR